MCMLKCEMKSSLLACAHVLCIYSHVLADVFVCVFFVFLHFLLFQQMHLQLFRIVFFYKTLRSIDRFSEPNHKFVLGMHQLRTPHLK